MKRIYRDDRNGKIAGICAGLGEILKVDPTVVRLVTVFCCVLTGFAPLIAAYVVGWFIIPTKTDLIARGELPPAP